MFSTIHITFWTTFPSIEEYENNEKYKASWIKDQNEISTRTDVSGTYYGWQMWFLNYIW